MKQKFLIRVLALLGILGLAYVVNKYGLLKSTLNWIEGLGSWGPVIFVLVYTLTAICFVPSVVFTFAAGVLFGLPWGIPYTVIGSGFGAVSAFLIGRYFARDWVSKAFSNHQNFIALDRALSRKGWKIVTLARLSPIFPFLVANYAFGLTRISAGAYFVASMLGTIPSNALYVYLGSLTGDLASLDLINRSRTPAEWGLLFAGFIATVILTLYIRRISLTALEKNLDEK